MHLCHVRLPCANLCALCLSMSQSQPVAPHDDGDITVVNKCCFLCSFLSLFHTTCPLHQWGDLPPAPPSYPTVPIILLPCQLPEVLSLQMQLLGAGFSLHLLKPHRR